MKRMDEIIVKTLFILDERHFEGIVTLGDIQRAIINNVALKKRMPKRLKNILRPQINYYQYYRLDKSGYKLADNWIEPFFDIDGHPSFTSDDRYMLTDSYPDINRYRRYVIYETLTRKGMIVAKMPENKLAGNVGCDLHPKLSKDNNYVIFDNTSLGKHSMIVFKIDWASVKTKISK